VSRLHEAQSSFVEALLDPERPVPPGLRVLGEPAGADRFAVYRNNVMVGLIEGLRDAYPIVCRLVGDEFFCAMAAIFARAYSPRSPVMLEYGEGFAEFIARFPPAAGLPYLADIARLERAWVEAYHAAEAEPGEAPMRLHPATRLVRSRYPILTIWQANQTNGEPGPLELTDEGDNVLVRRPGAEVQACCIPDDAAELLEALASDDSIEPGEQFERLRSVGAFGAASG
jgi:hypothetical protein